MQTLSFVTPKFILTRLVDMFQKPDAVAAQTTEETHAYQTSSESLASHTRGESLASKTKLNVTVDDLKVISTALLHYKRNLAKLGEMQKAENVGQIDKKFYDLITQLSE
jgi:hypothetical protein